eukprot:scaffold4180_cov99-Cylindrotheca_fusiformis.AAC.2
MHQISNISSKHIDIPNHILATRTPSAAAAGFVSTMSSSEVTAEEAQRIWQEQEASSKASSPPEAEAAGTPAAIASVPATNPATKDKLSDYLFCFASFHAVFGPVCICMILSALCVVHINTEQSREAGAQALSNTYEVFSLQEDNAGHNFLASIGNTLIIVCVICVMTFAVVLLYKFKCMKIFYAYMILVTTMLLGYFSTNMLLIAFEKFNIRVDWFSLVYVMYNFAVVGTLSIFYGRGIPKFIPHGYLICTSVVLAWQLSFFGTWTAWTLLVALALYDLFAVLTPCGPLRKLAELMSQPDAPAIPGLLYEAALPNGIEKPTGRKKANNNRQPTPNESTTETQATVAATMPQTEETPTVARGPPEEEEKMEEDLNNNTDTRVTTNLIPPPAEERARTRRSQPSQSERRRSDRSVTETSSQRFGKIPLSLAMVYKLQIVDEEGLLTDKSKRTLFRIGKAKKEYQSHSTEDEAPEYSGLELRQRKDLTPKQLRTEVKVIYPHRGGRIEKTHADDNDTANNLWGVYNRSGDLLREFVVDQRTGRVYHKGQAPTDRPNSNAIEDNSIKLGLGDFIFYSVLVSKAALYGFTSFAVCMLVILAGLGVTLLLLSVYGKALPALPVSIFFGVAFFFISQAVVDPWLLQMIRTPIYV